ncbi:MAG: bifunctional sulfate adenylyltransferase/adenylylsulfate kinase [Candidatus Pacebacteria bacterium]|nr:bifunctional sulfate adenylyltransferase/adenylylsulfate kinase [Candidatus Paceibacterota bacterium]
MKKKIRSVKDKKINKSKPKSTLLKENMASFEEREALHNDITTLPRLTLTDRQLSDLELILNGGFSPLEGFLNKDDYESVVENNRLVSGDVWSMPIVLDISKDHGYKKDDRIILCDSFGIPLAIMDIESVYTPDKKKEAQYVFGTNDPAHFGVKTLFERMGSVYLGGKVKGLELPSKYDFLDLRRTPQEMRDWFEKQGWDKVVGFQTRNPMHRAHFEIVKRAAQEIGGQALIHPVVGQTKDGDIDYVTRVRSYKLVLENHAKDFAAVSLLPLAMRMGGPREALWHALIRKNYGCTHFIVGRDHASPGKDLNGVDFYGSYDAQDLVKEYEEEIGIKLVTPKEMVYVEEERKYFPRNEIEENHTVKNISGTQLRQMLLDGDEIPKWFSFPEVVQELRRSANKKRGFVLFFTGLSGAGKTTIAELLRTRLYEMQDKEITFLDGDVIRNYLSKGLSFSKEDRDTNIERIGFVASEATRHGGITICSAIAPYEKPRNNNRKIISEFGVYIEVFVDTSLKECKKRDTKGLYAKAEQGLIKGLTGVDDPYEKPKSAEIILETESLSPQECVDQIISYLKENKLI